MPYLYLLLAIFGSAMLSVMSSLFGRKNAHASHTATLYNLIVTLSAAFAWGVLYLATPGFEPGVLIYSAIYGVFYAMAMTGIFKAIASGSVSMTGFVKQLSLIAVAFWGFLFWETAFTLFIGIGLLLIFIALVLCFKPNKKKENTLSPSWFFYASLLLVGNAGCSIVQKYQQAAFNGKYGNMFMFFAILFAVAVCFIFYLKEEKTDIRSFSPISLLFPVMGGISSTVLNLFILLLLASPMSESVIFPGIAVGGLILTTLFSVAVCKEKLHPIRWIGLGVGAVALIFLNL